MDLIRPHFTRRYFSTAGPLVFLFLMLPCWTKEKSKKKEPANQFPHFSFTVYRKRRLPA